MPGISDIISQAPVTVTAPSTSPNVAEANALAVNLQPTVAATPIVKAVKVAEKKEDSALDKLTVDFEKATGLFQQIGKDLKNLNTAHDKATALEQKADTAAAAGASCTTVVNVQDLNKNANAPLIGAALA